METAFVPLLVTAASTIPSPLKSPVVRASGKAATGFGEVVVNRLFCAVDSAGIAMSRSMRNERKSKRRIIGVSSNLVISGKIELWFHLVECRHTGIHVIVDVAVEHPDAGIIWNHVDGFHLRLHERHHIRTLAVVQ